MLANRAVVIAALAIGSTFPATGREETQTVMTCTNLASGARWQIRIDYDRAKVDANDARISAAEISWHDAGDGGNYTLNRKSGELTMVAASSTGGYFLHDHCTLDKPG